MDPKYGVGLNQYACGWTILQPFGSNTINVRRKGRKMDGGDDDCYNNDNSNYINSYWW